MKTLIVPALISLILFLVSSYVLYPLWQRYRSRYSNYLPLETITNQTLSLRARFQNGIANLLAPSSWRRSAQDRLVVAESGSEVGYDSDDGEELGEVDESTRRHGSRQGSIDSTPRLSRE